MLVLALDTTTRQGSIAVARDHTDVDVFAGDAAVTHGERLPGDLIRLLDANQLRLADIDIFAVAAGPGSFTGLRIGIATMQGLALANEKPLVGVSALDAMNHSLHTHRSPSAVRAEGDVCIWMDAQRGQVFSAVYRTDRVVEGPLVDAPGVILARWRRSGNRPVMFAGDGAAAYRDAIAQAFPEAHTVAPPPLAPSVASLAAAQLVSGTATGSPDAIRPLYVRRSDAELARDRNAQLT